MMRAVGLALAVAAVAQIAGCRHGPERREAVQLEGECRPLTDAVHLFPLPIHQPHDGRYLVLNPGLGILDGRVLVSWWAYDPTQEEPGGYPTTGYEAWISWYDETLAPLGEPISLGLARGLPRAATWIRHGDALVAQVWTSGTFDLPPAYDESTAAMWIVRPLEAPVRVPLEVPVRRLFRALDPVLGLSGSAVQSGQEGRLPAALAGDSPVFAVVAIPAVCRTHYANGARIVLLSPRGPRPLLAPGEPPCNLAPEAHHDASNPFLVSLPDGDVGVFFRLSGGLHVEENLEIPYGRVHYVRVGPDLEPRGDPVLVGQTVRTTSGDGGYQPKAARIGSHSILFTDRVDAVRNSYNSCQHLVLIEDDGTGSRLAPWQLPCWNDPREWFTASSELAELPEGRVAIAWGERSSFGLVGAFGTELTPEVEWEEHVSLAMIGAGGWLASPIVEVTDEAATAVGGRFPNDFLVRIVSEGSRVVVLWVDRRAEAPGFYGRVFECSPHPAQ